MRARYVPMVSMVIGTTVGGSIFGAGVAFVREIAGARRSGTLILALSASAMSLCVLASISPRLQILLPYPRRQVRRELLWLHGRVKGAFIWGIDLGAGFRTYIVTPALYGLLAIGLLLRDSAGIAVLTMYGLARGSSICALAIYKGRRVDTCNADRLLDGRVARLARWPLLGVSLGLWVTLIRP